MGLQLINITPGSADTAPQGATKINAMMTEIYSGSLWATPTFTQITINSGATAPTSLMIPAANATIYSLLGSSNAGPGIQARWDASTSNRYIRLGHYDNTGVFSTQLDINNGVNVVISNSNVVINAPSAGSALAVNGLTGQNVYVAQSTGAAAGMGWGWNIGIGGSWNIYAQSTDQLFIGTTGTGSVIIATAAAGRITVSGAGNTTFSVPASGTTVTINSINATVALAVTAPGASNAFQFGWAVGISAGAWNIFAQGADGLSIGSASGPFQIGTTGNAQVTVITNGLTRVSVGTTGAVIISAPTAGNTLTVTGLASSYAISVITNASGWAFGFDANSSSTGAFTPTLTANKPGAGNAGVIQWLKVNMNGSQGWIPVFGN